MSQAAQFVEFDLPTYANCGANRSRAGRSMDRRTFLAACAGAISSTPYCAEEIRYGQIQSGRRFATTGIGRPTTPLLFHLSTTAESSLVGEFANMPRILASRGFLCASVDIPCHGQDRRAGEPEGLDGWRFRIERREPLMVPFAAECAAVLDALIGQKACDPGKIFTSGISRGAFCALCLAAADPRIAGAAGLAPLTDLGALHELAGLDVAPEQIDAARLAHKAVGLWIGNQDDRVGTDSAIRFAARSLASGADVELHVISGPSGHHVPARAESDAAAWIQSRQPGG
jgi:predicted esterase